LIGLVLFACFLGPTPGFISPIVPLVSLLAFGLGFASLFAWRRSVRRWAIGHAAGWGLLLYICLAAGTDQFMWVSDTRRLLFAVAWLIPPAIGAVLLPSRGYWLSGLGCWAVLFAGAAALTYTASHRYSGMGLFGGWIY
jgi:hypothetical protein